MTKCVMCNENQYVGSLCLLHVKYYQQLTGPHFETLYDLLWWKYSFLKHWDNNYGIKLEITCSDNVHAQKFNIKTMSRVRDQVWKALGTHKTDLSSYYPLAKKLSYSFSQRSGVDFEDLYQECLSKLTDIENKLANNMNVKQISTWVRKSLKGTLRNFIARKTGIVKGSEVDLIGEQVDYILDGGENPEETYIRKQKYLLTMDCINKLMHYLTVRQQVLVANMFNMDELPRAEIAKMHGVDQSTISRDFKTIYEKAEALNV